MPKTQLRILLAAIGITFAAALLAILRYGFSSGAGYTSLSSLRSDPDGLEILYEALGRLPSRSVDRNYQPFNQASFQDTSLLIAGLQIDSADLQGGEWFDRFDRLASDGNRIIIALQPKRSRFQQLGAHLRTVQLMRRGILLQRTSKEEADDEKTHWPIYFTPSKKWTVLHKLQGRAVLVERKMGKGSLVLLADSYPLSNRAMVKNLDPSLLSLIVGASHRVVFDETHLGIVESGSLVGLARHYGLQSFMVGLFLLAGLFVWRAMSAFPPRLHQSQLQPPAKESDSLLGFSRLLARNLPANQLMSACMTEYRNAFPKALEKQPIAEFTAANKSNANPVASFREAQLRLGQNTKSI